MPRGRPGVVWLPATLDTKGHEATFLADEIRRRGCTVNVVDVGILSDSPSNVGVDSARVALEGGMSIVELRARRERAVGIEVMGRGLARLLADAHESGNLDGVISVGGSVGTSIATAAMRTLPVGVPKLMVSTVASGNTLPYVGGKDITMMFPVADIVGLNRITRTILAQAAGAISGMVDTVVTQSPAKVAIAVTCFGATTPCVVNCKAQLEGMGFEVVVFHARGTGGQVMEELITDGVFAAVLDVTTTEIADEIAGGTLSAGPHRLEAAGRSGVPQVVVPGALDMVNFGPMATVPVSYSGRVLHQHGPAATLMRTNKDEMRRIGEFIAGKLNQATGPARIVVPLNGFSDYDRAGGPFQDEAANAVFLEAVRSGVSSRVSVVVAPLHVNDPEFADLVVTELLNIMAAD